MPWQIWGSGLRASQEASAKGETLLLFSYNYCLLLLFLVYFFTLIVKDSRPRMGLGWVQDDSGFQNGSRMGLG